MTGGQLGPHGNKTFDICMNMYVFMDIDIQWYESHGAFHGGQLSYSARTGDTHSKC